jgi:ATP-dependent Zn protease
MAQVERGDVVGVTFTGRSISGVFKNGQEFRTFAPSQAEGLVDALLEKGVEVNARDANSSWLGHIISWTPIVIMIAFLIFFMRRIRGGTATMTRIWDVLSGSERDLTEAEIASQLSRASRVQLRSSLYQMVREGTVVFTSEKKYRVKTVD